jgi:tryptophanyl-tRNA synthetase
MFTDPQRVKLSDSGHPDVCNVFFYYCIFAPEAKEDVFSWCVNAQVGCTECKKRLAERLTDKLAPFQKKRQQLLGDIQTIAKILKDGSVCAREVASHTISEARTAMKI